jgi:hypothetical protein
MSWFALSLAFAAAQAPAQDNAFCTGTAQTLLSACRATAQSDLLLAQAKCLNVSDRAARAACERQTQTDSQAALQLCDDESTVRQGACQRLGQGRYDPVINPANFTNKIDNPYFPLKPGTTFVYEGTTGGAKTRVEFAVTHNTVQILGIRTVEVHDSVFTDGQLTEDTLDWFAQDLQGNVWYFGENTEELINGRPSTLDGTFTSGVNGAKPGIIMRAHPVVGKLDRQESDLDNAEDFAAVVSLTETVNVPEGTFTHVLRTHETTPLEPDLKEDKFYAPGVGNVLTRDLNTTEEIRLIDIQDGDSKSASAVASPSSAAAPSDASSSVQAAVQTGPGVSNERHRHFRPF